MKVFEVRDMLVTLWWDPTPGFFRARAWEEFGRTTPPVQVQLPFSDRRFVSHVDGLDALDTKGLQYVGARLFDSLFQGDILRLYLHLREQIRPAGSKLRIRLRVDPLIAARLPWEFLYDTRLESFLLDTEDTTVIRFYPAESEPAPVAVRLPLRLLLAASCPSDSEEVARVSREAKAVRSGLQSLEEEGLVAIREMGSAFNKSGVTRAALEEWGKRDVDVLQLIAPCRLSSDGPMVALVDVQGASDWVSGEDFARLLKGASSKLVVVSGGKGAGAIAPELAQRLLAGAQGLLVHRGDAEAGLVSRFAGGFYRGLAEMRPVDAALADARADTVGHYPVGRGWQKPCVFLCRKDARVFYNEARERVQKVYQLSEGRYRSRLRETLNRLWPKPERYTRQLIRWIPRHEPLTAILQSADHLGQPQSATSFASRFQRLLLFGDAGAGKTMNLCRLFYEAAQPILSYHAKSPLPMFVSLPELPPRTNLVDFLAEGLDRELFFKDLEEGRFLFLMDSVDGFSSGSAKRLSSALNEFMRRYPLNRYIVTARRPLPVSVELPNWVELLALDQWEAIDFLIGDGAMRAESAKLLYQDLHRVFGSRVGNPHLLSMARRLWREGASIPTTLSGLSLAFYQVAGGSLSPELRNELLPKLAMRMSLEGRSSITRAHLEEQAGAKFRRAIDFRGSGFEEAEVDDLLTELSKTRLLRGPKSFSFPSLGVQEFLTGLALCSVSIEDVLNLIQPAQWTSLSKAGGRPFNLRSGSFHGAIPFLSGFLDDSSELIERLIERDLLLASQCCREARFKTPVDDLLRAAIQHALRQDNTLLQRVACLCLEARGDRWAVAVLERIAVDPAFSSRAQALEALGTLQSHRSLPLLEAAAKEKDPDVSRAALDALNRMKAS